MQRAQAESKQTAARMKGTDTEEAKVARVERLAAVVLALLNVSADDVTHHDAHALRHRQQLARVTNVSPRASSPGRQRKAAQGRRWGGEGTA